eukprot:357473-Chlamydomonas_euryale.AAC.11
MSGRTPPPACGRSRGWLPTARAHGGYCATVARAVALLASPPRAAACVALHSADAVLLNPGVYSGERSVASRCRCGRWAAAAVTPRRRLSGHRARSRVQAPRVCAPSGRRQCAEGAARPTFLAFPPPSPHKSVCSRWCGRRCPRARACSSAPRLDALPLEPRRRSDASRSLHVADPLRGAPRSALLT